MPFIPTWYPSLFLSSFSFIHCYIYYMNDCSVFPWFSLFVYLSVVSALEIVYIHLNLSETVSDLYNLIQNELHKTLLFMALSLSLSLFLCITSSFGMSLKKLRGKTLQLDIARVSLNMTYRSGFFHLLCGILNYYLGRSNKYHLGVISL